MSGYAEKVEDGWRLRIRATPGARTNAIGDIFTDGDGRDWLKISVTSPPDKGKANQAIIRLLSKTCGVPASAIQLQSGETARLKVFILPETATLPSP